MNLNKLYQSSPNFTILLPGSCNAKCSFCFWNRESAQITADRTNWVKAVTNNLKALPNQFRSVSISGGEPSLSKHLFDTAQAINVFRMVNPGRIQRVVLTTNMAYPGSVREVLPLIDHLNISRHGVNDDQDFDIFKVRTTRECDISMFLRTHKPDACMNAVVSSDLRMYPGDSSSDICARSLINRAASMGFQHVSIRKVASDVAPTPAELVALADGWEVLSENNCPVCRSRVMRDPRTGIDVRWKGSVSEPSVVVKSVYEAVMHPDGKVYADWGMKHELPLANHNMAVSGTYGDAYRARYASIRKVDGGVLATAEIGCGSYRGCGGG